MPCAVFHVLVACLTYGKLLGGTLPTQTPCQYVHLTAGLLYKIDQHNADRA